MKVIKMLGGLFQNARLRLLAAFVMAFAMFGASGVSFAADGDITAADFTSLAAKVLTYLGFAVAAGLTVLVATVAAQAGWKFFQKFIK
jgi:hypothetical protein